MSMFGQTGLRRSASRAGKGEGIGLHIRELILGTIEAVEVAYTTDRVLKHPEYMHFKQKLVNALNEWRYGELTNALNTYIETYSKLYCIMSKHQAKWK